MLRGSLIHEGLIEMLQDSCNSCVMRNEADCFVLGFFVCVVVVVVVVVGASLLTHGFKFGVERRCGLLHLAYFALQQAHALARGDDVVLELLEDGARVSGQVGELAEAARERHVADGAQVLEEQALIVGHGVPAQQLRLHDPFSERHFLQTRNRSAPLPTTTASSCSSCKLIQGRNGKKQR